MVNLVTTCTILWRNWLCDSTISSKISSATSQLDLSFHLLVLTYCSSWRSIWEWNLENVWTIFLATGFHHMTPALCLTITMMYTNWLPDILRRLTLISNWKRKRKRSHKHREKRTKELHGWKSWQKKRKVYWGRKVLVKEKEKINQ